MDGQLKEYEKLKKELREALEEKKQLESKYAALEQEIYDKETQYLSLKPSSKLGNIVTGFQGFNKNNLTQQLLSESSNLSHPTRLDDNERIFSMSSALFVRQIQGQNEDE